MAKNKDKIARAMASSIKAEKANQIDVTALQNAVANPNSTYADVALTHTGGQYMAMAGELATTTNGYAYAVLEVSAGERYEIAGWPAYDVKLFVIKNASGVISYRAGSETGATKITQAIEIPEGATELYVNSRIASGYSTVKKCVKIENTANPLYGKTIYADGDSVPAATGSYVDLIAAANKMILTKTAVSSTTLAVRDGRTDSILERVKAHTGSYDYILLEGGFNDLFNGVTLGTLSTGYEATLDESTIIGAVESICKELTLNHFGSKVLFVLAHRKIGTFAAAQAAAWAGIISALEKWSIPYVNMMKETNLAAWTEAIGTANFTEAAGTHPNLANHKKVYYPIVEAKLKKL